MKGGSGSKQNTRSFKNFLNKKSKFKQDFLQNSSGDQNIGNSNSAGKSSD